MKMKSHAKFQEKLTCCLENDMRNFANFHQSTRKCQNWNFDKILLSKVENVWASNLQWNTKIEEELTCRFKIDMNFTNFDPSIRKVFFFCFNWLLVTKVYIIWGKKVQRSYLSWHWGVMKILKKDWPVVWKKAWEIWPIFTRALESVKVGTLMGYFCQK